MPRWCWSSAICRRGTAKLAGHVPRGRPGASKASIPAPAISTAPMIVPQVGISAKKKKPHKGVHSMPVYSNTATRLALRHAIGIGEKRHRHRGDDAAGSHQAEDRAKSAQTHGRTRKSRLGWPASSMPRPAKHNGHHSGADHEDDVLIEGHDGSLLLDAELARDDRRYGVEERAAKA